MQKVKHLFFPLLIMILILGVTLNYWGCSNNSPLAPQETRVTNQNDLHIIPLSGETTSLSKSSKDRTETSAWVTVKNGGNLNLKYVSGDLEVGIKLNVKSKSINRDANLTLNLNPAALDMNFGPDDITFSKPALMNIEAEGLDLSGADPDKIDIYFVNPETNTWEKLTSRTIKVDIEEGKIKIINAEIHHFSRYAVGWGE